MYGYETETRKTLKRMETGHKMDFDSLIIEYLTGGLRGENAREFLRMVETDEECARRFDELNRLYA